MIRDKFAKKWFCLSSGMILFITGAAKVWSVLGGAKILEQIDPVFGLQFARLMFIAGILELIIAGICLFSKSRMLPLMLVAWLATNLSIYRMGLSNRVVSLPWFER
jgi:hypothetical protein